MIKTCLFICNADQLIGAYTINIQDITYLFILLLFVWLKKFIKRCKQDKRESELKIDRLTINLVFVLNIYIND